MYCIWTFKQPFCSYCPVRHTIMLLNYNSGIEIEKLYSCCTLLLSCYWLIYYIGWQKLLCCAQCAVYTVQCTCTQNYRNMYKLCSKWMNRERGNIVWMISWLIVCTSMYWTYWDHQLYWPEEFFIHTEYYALTINLNAYNLILFF